MNGYIYDYLFKIVLVGDSGVGKTSLVQRYADNIFNDEQMSTIGVDFAIKTIKIGNQLVKLQLWDTSGHERFKSVLQHKVYRGSSAFIFVYDMDNPESLQSINRWMTEVEEGFGYSKFKYLVGNKQDIVSEDTIGKEFAEEKGLVYLTTSAKTGYQVQKLILDLTLQLIDSEKSRYKTDQLPEKVDQKSKNELTCGNCCRVS